MPAPETDTQTTTSFGDLLKLLRKRARLTQRELGIAAGYSETQITRLEGGSRLPDPVIVKTRFVDALDLKDDPHLVQQLIALAEAAHDKTAIATTASASRTNLPSHLSRFIGRGRELEEIIGLVSANRLVTLTGAGGAGKTRLALEVGLRMLNHFADGVQLAELAPVADAALVAQTVSAVFKVTNQSGHTYADVLRVLLAGKQLLLILDNCEHVIFECAQLAEALLRACPALHILATSREALNIQGEVAWRVPSMGTDESAQLFAEHARTAKTDFMLSEHNAVEVTAICTRLDGIPLAIELAASRLSGLTVKQLAARLDDRFNLLTNGKRTALARHQTLRALITWSYDLLTDQERALLRRLSVFAGGWTAEAAEAVCATPQDSPADLATLYGANVLPLLLGLVNKSLVIANDQDEQTRYHMLETIRQYAWEQLESTGETATIQARHARYFLAYLKRTAPAKMRETHIPCLFHANSMAGVAWITRLMPDRDNLRAALIWSLQQGHDTDVGVQLALWQHLMWELHGPRHEGRNWLAIALSYTSALKPTRTHAWVLTCLGNHVSWLGDRDKASEMFDEALSIFKRTDDRFGIMCALSSRANFDLGDVDTDEDNVREWLTIAQELKDLNSAGVALWYLGNIYDFRRDNLPQALNYYAESLATLPEHEHGLRHVASYYQALALRRAGQTEGTLERIQDALAFFRVSGFVLGVLGILQWLGDLAVTEGDYDKARTYLFEGIEIGYRDGSQGFTNWYFGPLAALAAAEGNDVRAVTLAAASEALGGQLIVGHKLALINAARANLDEQTLTNAEAAGRAMSFDQAVAYALACSSIAA